ncbi:MAG: PAS domain-containing protein [Phycisphaerales bacterium]|nr:PAS domain-containing protein [Phycisphaerales bacterium]MCB9862506.1 PAS domain-containing protein [Phycisphaerales bacterium]
MSRHLDLTGREQTFGEDEIIVSKTDLKGKITYANEVFLRVAGYTEHEVLGKPHNIIRHPDMPRCVFKLLWDTIESGKEIFAYVINRCKNGDHYWVFAHVTPTFDDSGRIVSYHSNRRVPDRTVLTTIKGLYQTLLNEERKHRNPKDQMAASMPIVLDLLKSKGMSYEELIFSLKHDADSRRAKLEKIGA